VEKGNPRSGARVLQEGCRKERQTHSKDNCGMGKKKLRKKEVGGVNGGGGGRKTAEAWARQGKAWGVTSPEVGSG